MLLHRCKDAKTSLHPTSIIVTDVVHDHLGQFLFVSAISKCHFSPKWNIVFYWMAYRRYTALYTNLLVGLKPVKP